MNNRTESDEPISCLYRYDNKAGGKGPLLFQLCCTIEKKSSGGQADERLYFL